MSQQNLLYYKYATSLTVPFLWGLKKEIRHNETLAYFNLLEYKNSFGLTLKMYFCLIFESFKAF